MRAAIESIRNAGLEFPGARITVSLAPADVRKEGAAFDLPTAVGILCATGLIKPGRLDRALVMGELSLDASVRSVRGVLPVALHARREGFTPLLVPAANAPEASVVDGIDVIPIATLHDAVEYLNGEREIGTAFGPRRARLDGEGDGLDFADVRGLEIAAGGAHNVLMIGPIPTGKAHAHLDAIRMADHSGPDGPQDALATLQREPVDAHAESLSCLRKSGYSGLVLAGPPPRNSRAPV